MGDLKGWMEQHGILLCNTNPELPALEDTGCAWQDSPPPPGTPGNGSGGWWAGS